MNSRILCPLFHPCCWPARFNIYSANKQNIAAKNTLCPCPPSPHRPLIYCAAMAPPEIRMFIYGHQYLIRFTLILCWWVQKSRHGCLNIKINWSPDTVKRLEVIVLGEQVASQVAAWIYCPAHTGTHAHTHAVRSRQMSSFGFPARTSRSIWAEWKLFTAMLNQVRRHLKSGSVNHFNSESTPAFIKYGGTSQACHLRRSN